MNAYTANFLLERRDWIASRVTELNDQVERTKEELLETLTNLEEKKLILKALDEDLSKAAAEGIGGA